MIIQARSLSLLVLFAFALFSASAHAANRFVRADTGSDTGFLGIPNPCLQSLSPCLTIAHAVSRSQSGDEIRLAGDFDESVLVTKSLSFVGRRAPLFLGNAFLSCSGETGPNRCPRWTTTTGSDPALVLSPGAGGSILLEDIRFEDVSGRMAVTVDSGSLVIRDARFRNNVNTLPKSVPFRRVTDGGALTLATNEPVLIEDSIFSNNRDSPSVGFGSGGAVFSLAPLRIERTTFQLNSAYDGGAIVAANALTVTDSTFEQNFASHDGGAIRSVAGVISITGGVFRTNIASRQGGALQANSLVIGTSSLEIQGGTLFEGNRVDLDPNFPDGAGGAIALVASIGQIDDAEFRSNSASSLTVGELCGVALCALEGSIATVADSIFDGNLGESVGSFRTPGVVDAIDSELEILRTTVSDDLSARSDSISAVSLTSSELILRSSTLRDYYAGIYIEEVGSNNGPNSVEVFDSTLHANAWNMTSRGGGAQQNHDVAFYNSTLSGASVTNVSFENDGTYIFEHTTLADADAFEFNFNPASSSLFVEVRDSVVEGDCTSSGSNVFNVLLLALGTKWNDTQCGFGPGYVPDLALEPLADNGGPTLTHGLGPTSPARDAAGLRCLASPIDGLDQRGEMRPVGTFCDSGAVEAPEPAFAIGLALGSLLLASRRRPGTSTGRVCPRRRC